MNTESRMTVRKMPFIFSADTNAQWNVSKPEFSQMVNGASLAMPYLEPYLIRSMRKARPLISDPELQKSLDEYVHQEAQHYQQHKKYNTEMAKGYGCVSKIEAQLAADYKNLENNKSLRFNLAYAEGFESMALAIGHMLIENREFLFGGSESSVASLILWHFVEEIEHKNVAFDVFDHIYGNYFWRMWGLIYATAHIMWRTQRAYRNLLIADGLWANFQSRKRLAKVLLRIISSLVPKMLKICKPNYHPKNVADPEWAIEWAQLFRTDPNMASNLDTVRFDSSTPIPLSRWSK